MHFILFNIHYKEIEFNVVVVFAGLLLSCGRGVEYRWCICLTETIVHIILYEVHRFLENVMKATRRHAVYSFCAVISSSMH